MKKKGRFFFLYFILFRHTVLFMSFVSLSLAFFFPSVVSAQVPVDEEAMFSNSDTVIEKHILPADDSGPKRTKASLGVSGTVSSINTVSLRHADDEFDNVYSDSAIVSNLFFDARYATFYKFFANWEIYSVHPWDKSGQAALPEQPDKVRSRLTEIFMDTPIRNTVYLRWGKQVLQWGRCKLWNPTDLINVDKETFIKRTVSKEGVYGVKVHVPSGTRYNFYGFIDTGKELDSNKTGGAVKFEFLTGKTEMAFSFWDKARYLPVYGYDFSTRAMKLDLAGEISASKGFVRDILKDDNGVLLKTRSRDDWFIRASFDVGRNFKFNDQPDKINVTCEAFYNGAGYTKKIFNDGANYAYADPVTLSDGTVKASGDKKTFFLLNNMYDANYYGRYYLALFTSVNKFITSDYTLNNNVIVNVSDGSGIFSTGIQYQNLNNWEAALTAYVFLGPQNREYTVSQIRTSFQLSATYRF